MACAFHGNNGVLVVDRGGWEVLPETERPAGHKKKFRMAGEPRRSARKRGLSSQACPGLPRLHGQRASAPLRRRGRPQLDDRLSSGQRIAYRTGRRVAWDIDKEQVTGDAEQQALVLKEYRAPWSLKSFTEILRPHPSQDLANQTFELKIPR